MIKNIAKILRVVTLIKSPSLSSKLYFFLRLMVVPFNEIGEIIPKKGKIIDLGCGNGPLTAYLSLFYPNRSVTGWDINGMRLLDGIKLSKNLKNLIFEKKDAIEDEIPMSDAILTSDFLHHVPYAAQETIIRKIYKSLKSDGIFLIKEVDTQDIPRYWGSFIFDHFFYPKDIIYFRSKSDWLNLLKKNKFKVLVKRTLLWFPASTCLFICKKP